MKNNFWRNIVVGIVAIAIATPVAYAALEPVDKDKSSQDPNVTGGLSVAKCFAKGNTDFILFLNSFIFSDGLIEGLVEPWNDILIRNKCHGMDVSGLIKQQDKVKKYIRDAFLMCKSEKVPAYKRAFDELNAEIYYVRHVVDAGIVLSLPFDVLSTRMAELEAARGDIENNTLYYPTEKLYSEMKTKYVDSGDFEPEDFDLLFAKLEDKYEDKKKQYILCESGSWDEVSDKFTEFIESFEELGDDFTNDIGGAWEGIEESVGLKGGIPIESFSADGIGAFLGAYVQTNVNKQDPKAGLAELQEYSQEYVDMLKDAAETVGYLADQATTKKFESPGEGSSGSDGTSSVKDLLNRYTIEDKRFETEKLRSEMAAIIESNYGQVSDQVIKAFVVELDNLNLTIKAAYPKIDVIKECAKAMNDKQCVQ